MMIIAPDPRSHCYVKKTSMNMEPVTDSRKSLSEEFSRPEMFKLVHLDLKGAPPKVSFYYQFFPFVKSLGATGILIEYEDMFPYSGHLSTIPLQYAYSKEEIQQILQSARDNDLTVIPLIQTIGHLEYILKHKCFIHLREVARYPNSLCPCNPDSLNLIFEMVLQMVTLHKDIKWIHLGADEVWHLGICLKCKAWLDSNKETKTSLYLVYIKSLALRIKEHFPQLRLIIWDDMLRDVESPLIREIAGLLEVMVWHYLDEFNLREDLWEKYCGIFDKIWIASAFKGASDIAQMIPPIQYHLKNHISWLKTVSTEQNNFFQKSKLQGIALTGWQRYDHFTVLCELLPVGLPSLAVCLQTILDGSFSPETLKKSSRALGFNDTIPLEGFPNTLSNPSFPGANIYVGVNTLAVQLTEYQSLLQHQCYKGAFSSYLIKHNKTNPLHIDQFVHRARILLTNMEELNFQMMKLLNEIYYPETVEEWLDSNVNPYLFEIRNLVKNADEQLARNVPEFQVL